MLHKRFCRVYIHLSRPARDSGKRMKHIHIFNDNSGNLCGTEGHGQPPRAKYYQYRNTYTVKLRRRVQCQGREFLFIVPVHHKIEENRIGFTQYLFNSLSPVEIPNQITLLIPSYCHTVYYVGYTRHMAYAGFKETV